MTLEEAGEELLRGEPYTRCNLCQGAGGRYLRDEQGMLHLTKCHVCFERGFVPRVAYHEACRTLGLPIPRNPSRLKEALNAEYRRSR